MTANETAQVDISKSVSGTENWKKSRFFYYRFFKIGVPGGLKKVTAQPPVHMSICIPGGMSTCDLKVLLRGGSKSRLRRYLTSPAPPTGTSHKHVVMKCPMYTGRSGSVPLSKVPGGE